MPVRTRATTSGIRDMENPFINALPHHSPDLARSNHLAARRRQARLRRTAGVPFRGASVTGRRSIGSGSSVAGEVCVAEVAVGKGGFGGDPTGQAALVERHPYDHADAVLVACR